VTNLVMAWNTHQMQATLDRWRLTGERQVDSETYIGRRNVQLRAQMLQKICRNPLQRIQRPAAHREETQLQCCSEAQGLLVPRAHGMNVCRLEGEEVCDLKFGQICWQSPPAQERDMPGQHDVLPSKKGTQSCNAGCGHRSAAMQRPKRDF
jgi:hypothetical protein